jgi:hypothetical protein
MRRMEKEQQARLTSLDKAAAAPPLDETIYIPIASKVSYGDKRLKDRDVEE